MKPSVLEYQSIEKARAIIEFLQAREEARRLYGVVEQLSNQYSELYRKFEGPQPPSYWFYLWIRQLFLPLFEKADGSGLGDFLGALRGFIRKILRIG